MQNIQLIAREALKLLVANKKEPTPEAYKEAFYAQARKLDPNFVEDSSSLDLPKLLSMIESDVKEEFNRSFKDKDELSIYLIKSLNRVFVYKKNFNLQLDFAKFFLRILCTHPDKEVSTLAKGHLLDIDKLNFNSMNVWREKWLEQIKKISEFEFLDLVVGLEAIVAFEVDNDDFKIYQNEVAKYLRDNKPSKSKQLELFRKLEMTLKLMSSRQPQVQSEPTIKQQAPIPKKEPLKYANSLTLPIDSTTTLMDKSGMGDVLHFAESEFSKNNIDYAVIVFGIASYSSVISEYGQEAGKRVLSTLGRLLKQYSNDRDLIAYNGNDEFIACLLDRSDKEALEFIKMLDEVVEKSVFIYQQTRININLTAQLSSRANETSLDFMTKKLLDEFNKHKESQGIIKA